MGAVAMMRSVWFVAPRQVEVRAAPLPEPMPGHLRVRARYSAISAGTEMVAYRGQWPRDALLDEVLEPLRRPARFPFPYGYAVVGRVDAVGYGVDEAWLGRRVFVFHPHQSHVFVRPEQAIPIPDEVTDEDAVFYPNMETAITLVHDAAPLLGEAVAVFGLGVVGLLTAGLLARFPLARLVAFDHYPLRRKAAQEAGVPETLPPEAAEEMAPFADVSIEVSGSGQALQQALQVTRFHGKVVVGSWYGAKPVALNLGAHFHRGRLRLISSQVSPLNPALTGRWDRRRRGETAWAMLRALRPARWISHRFPVEEAPQAYALLDEHPDRCLQLVFTY